MFARSSLARIASQRPALGTAPQNARNMATLREIELRLKSVRNIEKITKVCMFCIIEPHLDRVCIVQSMKMIASTKLAKAQRAMQAGKQYGVANSGAVRISLRAGS